MDKLIITLAMTGNVPTKELNPATPMTPGEIADALREAASLGVSIAHLHARDGQGEPTHDRETYKTILDEIAAADIDIITQLSTGARGGPNTLESRGQMLDLDCEMASLATGSSNFLTSVNANSPDLVVGLAEKMVAHRIKPEIEIFDVSFIDNAARLVKKGILVAPLHFNLVMNVPGSIAGRPEHLQYMVQCLPTDSTWSVSGIGASQVPMLALAMELGGHVRTGLEDTLYYEKGVPATNRTLIERVLKMAEETGRAIAGPAEARKILSLSSRG